jgi:hypothetical protein
MGFTPYSSPGATLLAEPTPSVIARTFQRNQANTAASALTSGTLYFNSLPLLGGLLTSQCTFFTNTTPKTGGTHGWYVLMTPARIVVAVTADQTDAATVWGAAGTAYPLPWTVPFIVPATGLYYVGIMVANAAGQQPTITGCNAVAAGVSGPTGIGNGITLCGSSSVGQTTPPALGAQMAALSSNGGYQLYAYLE